MNDIILYWNAVTLEANRVSHTNRKMEQTGPTLSSRALAIVHIAMHDAFMTTTPAAGYAPYLPELPPVPLGTTTHAAVSAAAHATLWTLYPSQRTLFDNSLAEAGEVLNPGHEYGLQVARAILTLRASDPGAKDDGYVPSLERGRHKVDPDNPNQGFYSPFYGQQSGGFAITARHMLDAPPFANGTAPAYIQALRQVREKGITTSQFGTVPNRGRSRTNDETVMGLYWAYDGAIGLGTPPRLYNQIIRKLAIARNNTEMLNARMFALINVAMGDAGILAWDEKYRHNFWRPVVGIREHDRSMGMATAANNNLNNDCDCNWLPATNAINPQYDSPVTSETGGSYQRSQIVRERPKNFTPNFPAYPSGHATFGAAAFHITRLFYASLGLPAGAPNPMMGNRASDTLFDGLSMVSEEMNGINQDRMRLITVDTYYKK